MRKRSNSALSCMPRAAKSRSASQWDVRPRTGRAFPLRDMRALFPSPSVCRQYDSARRRSLYSQSRRLRFFHHRVYDRRRAEVKSHCARNSDIPLYPVWSKSGVLPPLPRLLRAHAEYRLASQAEWAKYIRTRTVLQAPENECPSELRLFFRPVSILVVVSSLNPQSAPVFLRANPGFHTVPLAFLLRPGVLPHPAAAQKSTALSGVAPATKCEVWDRNGAKPRRKILRQGPRDRRLPRLRFHRPE